MNVKNQARQELIDEFIYLAGRGNPQDLREYLDANSGIRIELLNGRLSKDGHLTALGFACFLCQKANVRFLVSSGAPYDIYCACILEDFVAIRKFVAQEPMLVHARSPHVGCVSLCELNVDVETLTLLETLGARIDIFVASQHGLLERVKALVTKEKNVLFGVNISGQTPLLMALKYGQFPIAEYLIAQGSDVTAKDYQGNTSLLLAVGGPESLVHHLCSGGAEINMLGPQQLPPILLAALHGNIEYVKAILQYRPQVNLDFSFGGKSFLKVLEDGRRDEIIRLLVAVAPSAPHVAAQDPVEEEKSQEGRDK